MHAGPGPAGGRPGPALPGRPAPGGVLPSLPPLVALCLCGGRPTLFSSPPCRPPSGRGRPRRRGRRRGGLGPGGGAPAEGRRPGPGGGGGRRLCPLSPAAARGNRGAPGGGGGGGAPEGGGDEQREGGVRGGDDADRGAGGGAVGGGALREDGPGGGGHVRAGVEGQGQDHGGPGGAEADPDGHEREGGVPDHGGAGDQAAVRPAARKRDPDEGDRDVQGVQVEPQQGQHLHGLRVHGPRPQRVVRHARVLRHPGPGQEHHPPDPLRPGVLPREERHAPRHEGPRASAGAGLGLGGSRLPRAPASALLGEPPSADTLSPPFSRLRRLPTC